jgi:two-component system alkaline phosphatase synthesis response regulator PhoP
MSKSMNSGEATAGNTRIASILVVDDEAHLAAGIRENLEAEGYAAEVAHDGAAGLERIRDGHFDLIVLDVMMPNMDGLELCAQIRREGRQTPVLFLTVKGDVADRVRGFEAGGDDYLAKPFHLKELLLRVAAILRRSSWYRASSGALQFGGNTIDFKTYEARAWDGAEHALTHKEAMILKALSERAGQIVTREEILDRVWGYEVFPSTRTIDNFIVRLRKRFERNPEAPAHFHTVRGVGYRFTAEPQPSETAE